MGWVHFTIIRSIGVIVVIVVIVPIRECMEITIPATCFSHCHLPVAYYVFNTELGILPEV